MIFDLDRVKRIMSQAIQSHMNTDDKKEALDDVEVAEVNEATNADAERSSINIKKLIRKVRPQTRCSRAKYGRIGTCSNVRRC